MIGQTNAINSINGKYEQLVNYTMLYDYGDECTDITGGWRKVYQYYSSTMNGSTGVLSKNATSITIQGANKSYGSCGAETTNKIDNTGYSKIAVLFNSAYCVPTNAIGGNEFFWLKTTSEKYNNNQRVYLGGVGASSTIPGLRIATFAETVNYNLAIVSTGKNGDANYGVADFSAVAMFKEDNWQALAEKAGITATSIDDILTNSNVLLSSKKAIEFMIKQCTGDFMASAVASETFLTALNNSPYKTLIWSNEHWAKFLNMIS